MHICVDIRDAYCLNFIPLEWKGGYLFASMHNRPRNVYILENLLWNTEIAGHQNITPQTSINLKHIYKFVKTNANEKYTVARIHVYS